ncbi:hypothetical protein COLO4_24831 [Corchorus olitorius]|uniref:Uncharacterized protein n=1 Tax=Corchorus olitorius TaxID=93759 RepID=A0A1R3I6C1_9ROSI|nr:hypothetical protein COLO4_24831 [Corchorus olitorius]
MEFRFALGYRRSGRWEETKGKGWWLFRLAQIGFSEERVVAF